MKKINIKKVDWEKVFDTCLRVFEEKEDAEYLLTKCEDTLKEEIAMEYATQEDYVNRKCGLSPLEYQSHSVSKPAKGKFIFSLVAALVFFAVCIGSFVASLVCTANGSTFKEMRKELDAAYQQWAGGWGSASSFAELEDTWYIVQDAWGERGLMVTWNDVLASKEYLTRYSNTIYSGELYEQLCADMANKMSEQEQGLQFLAIFSLVPAVIFTISTVKKGIIVKCNQNEYSEQEKRNWELANQNKDWLKGVEKAKAEYVRLCAELKKQKANLEEKKAAAKEKIKELEITIEKLTVQCNQAAEKIETALWQLNYSFELDSGVVSRIYSHLRDNDFQKAVEMYNEDVAQEQAKEEQRRQKRERIREEHDRIKREEEYLKRMERQAQLDRQSRERQAELDRKERERREKEIHRAEVERQREQHRREVDERLKRESEQRALISSMCRRCKNYGKCGIAIKSPDCHGFVPKN